MRLGAAAALLLVACGDGRQSDTPIPWDGGTPPPGSTPGEEAFALDGTFAVMRVVALEIRNPDTAHVFTDPDEDWFTQQTFMFLLSRWTDQGDGAVRIEEETCAIDISVIGGVDTVPGPGLLDSLVTVTLSGDAGGGRVFDDLTTAPYADVWGARLGAPLTDPLPQEPEDPTAWDQDRDGDPGVTIYLDVVDSDIRWTTYIAQRVIFALDGALVDGDRAVGQVIVSDAEQVLLDAQPGWLNATEPEVRPSEDGQLSYFEAVRVGEGIGCADLARPEVRAELFEYL